MIVLTISIIYPDNFEAFTSELLEYVEDMFHQYYIYSDINNSFKYPTTRWCFIVSKWLTLKIFEFKCFVVYEHYA